MSTLNKKLRTLMKNQCWTQKRLAERMCVSPDAVSSWVRGVNCPTLETVKELCKIFYIPIQDLTNDELDIPEFIEIGRLLPYPICRYRREDQDTIHILYDADLANGGILHRFVNPGGDECSAIYQGGEEVWWHYRENESKMIYDWNKRYSK